MMKACGMSFRCALDVHGDALGGLPWIEVAQVERLAPHVEHHHEQIPAGFLDGKGLVDGRHLEPIAGADLAARIHARTIGSAIQGHHGGLIELARGEIDLSYKFTSGGLYA
jgi:hypothetical protein